MTRCLLVGAQLVTLPGLSAASLVRERPRVGTKSSPGLPSTGRLGASVGKDGLGEPRSGGAAALPAPSALIEQLRVSDKAA